MTLNEFAAIVLMAELVGMLALGTAWAWLVALWAMLRRGAPMTLERLKWPMILTAATLALLGVSLLVFGVASILRIEG